MPDIAMCANHACPSRETCYRYTVKPNPYRQSYSNFAPKDGEDRCYYYWRADNEEKYDHYWITNAQPGA